MASVKNLREMTDNDIIEVVSEKTNKVVAKGNWYQDDILSYSTNCGFCKIGFRFRKVD